MASFIPEGLPLSEVSSPFGQDHSSYLASRLASAERDAKARRVAISRWLVDSLWTSDLVVGIPLNILVNIRDIDIGGVFFPLFMVFFFFEFNTW